MVFYALIRKHLTSIPLVFIMVASLVELVKNCPQLWSISAVVIPELGALPIDSRKVKSV